MFDVCSLSVVVYCFVCWLLIVACGSLCIVCGVLFVVCCSLLLVKV